MQTRLERDELSVPERAKLIKARVEMIEARRKLVGEVAQLAPLKKPGQGAGTVGGIRQAARDLGLPRDKVRRALAIADLPPATIEKAAHLGLDGNQ